jgi:thiol:disulfide interchange protein
MSKIRLQAHESQAADKPPNRRWIQITIIAGVALLAVAILFFKNQAAGAPAVSLADVQTGAGEGDDGIATADGELPQQRLERLLAGGQPTLAFFHSNNCVECTKMVKIVADVYPEFEDSVGLVDVDVYNPQNRALLQQARIQYIPTVIFYDTSGEESEFVVGAIPRQRFRFLMRQAAGEE